MIGHLFGSGASTDPASKDEKLRGRTYALPYVRVWEEILAQVAGEPACTLLESDPKGGSVRVEVRSRITGAIDRMEIRLRLDENGQSRVDLVSASRVGRPDLGRNARRIARFLQTLDRRLAPMQARMVEFVGRSRRSS